MKDNYFGEIEYSKQLDWYSCTLDIDSIPVFLSISAEKGEVDLKKAKALILELKPQLNSAKEYVESKMYECYCKEWSNFLFKANRKKFKEKLILNSVVIFISGEADLYFSDNGLFKGHDVVLRYNGKIGFFNERLSG